MFSIDITPASSILLGLMFAGILFCYIYALRAYIRAVKLRKQAPESISQPVPKASVIVYAECPEDLLEASVEDIMKEDYPDFEVIVVSDSSAENAAMLQERLSSRFDNVYVTFIPPGSHNVSRRKLAITSGAKAAKGEIIITTVGNIRLPESHKWLSCLMEPFCGAGGINIDVSLGLSIIQFGDLTGPGKWYRQFDSVLSDALWMGYAERSRPYRGDGFNLAFRRKTFFDHKGYARTINIHNGDDDLFISEIANGENTRIIVNKDCIVTTVWPWGANRIWRNRKEGYNFTQRWLRKGPFVRASFANIFQWIIPALAVGASLASLPNLLPIAVAGAMLLFFWGMEIFHYRRIAGAIGAVRLWWAVVPFWLWRPLANMFFRYDHRRSQKKNFTWERIS